MDSMPHGRYLVPVFEISRPLLKPPWSTCLSAIDSNHFPQASMISGVGFSNPKCRNINLFIAHPLLVVSLVDFVSGAGDGDRTRHPLLGKIRFRDSYLAKPKFRDFAGKSTSVSRGSDPKTPDHYTARSNRTTRK